MISIQLKIKYKIILLKILENVINKSSMMHDGKENLYLSVAL